MSPAHLVLGLAVRDAAKAALHEEGRDGVLAGVLGLGEHREHVRQPAVGDPALGARQQPAAVRLLQNKNGEVE